MKEEMERFHRVHNAPSIPQKALNRSERKNRNTYGYEDIEAGRGFTPSPYFEEANPSMYAEGGYVKGGSSGQADDVRTVIPKGSYVMNATDVSMIGDGNTEHGASRLSELEAKLIKSGHHRNYMTRHYPKSQNVNVHLSDGEYVLRPEAVNALGGPRAVDKMRKNIRKHKGVARVLPPKTKPLHAYVR